MAKERETEEKLDKKPNIDADEPERGEDGDEQAVDVRTKPDGGAEADVHQESRRERLARQRREEQDQAIERAVAPLRDMNQNLTRMMQDLHGRLGQAQAPVAKPAASADDDDEYTRLSMEMEEVIVQANAEKAAGSLTPERSKAIKTKYYKLEKQRAAIVAKSELSNYRPPQGPSFVDQQLQLEYPDVYGNEEANELAKTWTRAEMQERKARGKPPTRSEWLEICKKNMKRAGEVYGIIKPTTPEPSNGERQRFSGVGAHSRGGAGKTTRQLSAIDREAAAAMFPDDSESVQIEKFVRHAESTGYFDS